MKADSVVGAAPAPGLDAGVDALALGVFGADFGLPGGVLCDMVGLSVRGLGSTLRRPLSGLAGFTA